MLLLQEGFSDRSSQVLTEDNIVLVPQPDLYHFVVQSVTANGEIGSKSNLRQQTGMSGSVFTRDNLQGHYGGWFW
jgi:hypothetical protein